MHNVIFCGLAGAMDELIEKEIEAVRYKRKQESPSPVSLVINLEGNAKLTLSEQYADKGDYAIGFYMVDTASLKPEFDLYERLAIAILFSCNEDNIQVAPINDGIYFTDNTDKVYYSFSFSGNAIMYSSESMKYDMMQHKE